VSDDIAIPTRQRLKIARTEAIIVDGKVVRPANDNFVVDAVTGATRMHDSPLDRLKRTGAITPTQHEAGARYLADYYQAGLAPLGAFDYSRPVVDGASPKGHSDYRFAALQRWNGARAAMGDRVAAVADPVILHEQSIEAAGRSVGHANRPQAVAVATDRLIGALDILAKRYGLETKNAH
jgi:hypothetical protein